MKVVVDRVVQYANRYKLTNAETGEVLGTYDFEEVTGTVQEEGTEINKELFDSIQADLNNKLDKVTTPHVTRRAYIVNADGVTQGVLDIQVADIGNTLVMRGQDGSVLVSTITEANDGRSATPKSYVDGKYNDTVHISEQTLSEAEQEQALENLNVPNMYAKQNGTYSNLHAGYASMDGNGHVITDTYATKAVATQTSDGLMSAEDKVALDTLADTVDFDTIVRYTEQTGITEEQQTQAQENIGLPAQSAISRYNLGAFDSYVDNGDGTATITRRTGYYKVNVQKFTTNNGIGSFQMVIDLPSSDDKGYGTEDGYNHNATSNTYPLGGYGEQKHFYISNDNYLRLWDSNYPFTDEGLSQLKADMEAKGGMILQYETTTPYTEDVISERPINTLDQQAMWDIREEWEKGLNIFDDSKVRGKVLGSTSGFLYENEPFSIEPGVYSICVFVSDIGSVINTFTFNIFGSTTSRAILLGDIVSSQNACNKYSVFSITAEEADDINQFSVYYNAQQGQLSGKTLQGIAIYKGNVRYAYFPYHGGIIRENSTRLLRRSYCNNASIAGTAWHKVGTVPQSVIGVDTYQNYSGIFLISSVHAINNESPTTAEKASGVIEFDINKAPEGIVPSVNILSGNIPSNSVCAVVNGLSCDLYISTDSQYNSKQITLMSESTEAIHDEGLFVFNTNNDFSASAPSGAVYAVNRNTSSLEANGGTVNGDINVTGTVSEQGKRVYSPNNPPPAAVLYQHTITLSKRMSENGSICYITFAILSKKTGFLGYGLDIIFSLIEETCIFPASGNYPGDTVVNQMCGIVHSVTAVKAGSYLQINYIKYDPTTANAQFPDEYTVNITDDDGFSVTDQVMQIC